MFNTGTSFELKIAHDFAIVNETYFVKTSENKIILVCWYESIEENKKPRSTINDNNILL